MLSKYLSFYFCVVAAIYKNQGTVTVLCRQLGLQRMLGLGRQQTLSSRL